MHDEWDDPRLWDISKQRGIPNPWPKPKPRRSNAILRVYGSQLIGWLFVAAALAIVVFAATGCTSETSGSSGPTATPDTPRYTSDQVLNAARGQGVTCAKWEYQGRGIWACANNTFDENTGIANGPAKRSRSRSNTLSEADMRRIACEAAGGRWDPYQMTVQIGNSYRGKCIH